MNVQFNNAGKLRHLLTLEGIPEAQIKSLLDLAQNFHTEPGQAVTTNSMLANKTIANLFFEPSTRTRASFEIAAKRLSAEVINFDVTASSQAKGETILDTVNTLQAMNIDAFVVRHAEPGVSEFLAKNVAPHVSVINAGEAHTAHPTQGLLDALTVRQHKNDFPGLSVVIAGDVRRSRVARSAIHTFTTLGVTDIRLVGPTKFLPTEEEKFSSAMYSSFDEGIRDADVVMMLRIQKERMQSGEVPDAESYFQQYGLTEKRLSLAKPDALVMHPGPMNRGIEIDSAIADGRQSVIWQQVNNGVAVRIAVLCALLGET
ncbi:MAG: aspartate carbamoyltransferase catalytic subunit [Gammaproteobacteria bacterium]|nr:aspartate carbamoyltransferase catalytic subunit [Gammaproteobacteria bacterium]